VFFITWFQNSGFLKTKKFPQETRQKAEQRKVCSESVNRQKPTIDEYGGDADRLHCSLKPTGISLCK